MPIPLTRIDGVPDGTQVKPGMAYFADTGPGGMTCGSCLHRNPMHGGCAIYQKQTGQLGPRVALRWKACKFYKAKYRVE